MTKPIYLIAATVLMVGPALADPLLDKMRAQSKDGPIYAYEMIYATKGVTAVGQVDPSQPEGQRIQIASPLEVDWSDGFRDGLNEMEASADGDIWCLDFSENVPDDASLQAQTETSATYTFTPLPDADADKTEKKMMRKVDGEITLAKADGAILGFSMVLPKPYKPMLVAKIKQFDMQVTCARAPDGRTYVEGFDMLISGSAMMQSFNETISQRITALLEPVG